jgi:hypothetical protein
MVLANHLSLMGQTTPTRRSACPRIFRGIDWLVWEICEDATYVVLEPCARVTQDKKKIGTTLIAELA